MSQNFVADCRIEVFRAYLANDCFQLRDKYLKWFSLLEPVWLIWSCPKNYVKTLTALFKTQNWQARPLPDRSF